MQFINLTPHSVSIHKASGKVTTFPKPDKPARCAQVTEKFAEINGFDICRVRFGEVQDLPAPAPGVTYIVSRVVAEAVKGKRDDIVIPGPAIRDEQGHTIGAYGFSLI